MTGSTKRLAAPPKKLRKDEWLKIRVSPADQAAIKLHAEANGVSVADYVRAMCGLAPLYRKVREERPQAPVSKAPAPEVPPAPPPVLKEDEPVLSLAALMGRR